MTQINLSPAQVTMQLYPVGGTTLRLQIASGMRGLQGEAGANGQGVPAGGDAGDVLTKVTNGDYDTEWAGRGEFGQQFETIADAEAADIGPTVLEVRLLGHDALGDWGAARPAIRVSSAPSTGKSFRSVDRYLPNGTLSSANGGYWKIVEHRPNVKTYGAGLGDADDSAAFQAAIDATTNGAVAVIDIPSGTYTGDLSALDAGTRALTWHSAGAVTFSTSKPPGNIWHYPKVASRIYDTFNGNLRINGIDYDSGSGGVTVPALLIDVVTTHTSVFGSASNPISRFNVGVDIETQVGNPEVAVIASSSDNVGLTNSNAVGAGGGQFTGQRTVAAGGTGAVQPNVYGGNILAKDTTGEWSDATGPMVGLETDVTACSGDPATGTGEHQAGVRTVLAVIANAPSNATDGNGVGPTGLGAQCAYGIRVLPSNTAPYMEMKYGVFVYKYSAGAITTGVYVDAGSIAYTTADDAAKDIVINRTGERNPGILQIGSDLDTAVVSGKAQFAAYNSTGSQVVYGHVYGKMSTVTASSEVGEIGFQVLNGAGSLVTPLVIDPTAVSISRAFYLSGTSTATISADQDNYAPPVGGLSSTWRIDGGAADRNITGLSGGVSGRVLRFTNSGTTNNITLKDESASSTAGNRIALPGDVILPPGGHYALRYSGTASRWEPWETIPNSGVTAASYGGAGKRLTVTVGADGRVSSISEGFITESFPIAVSDETTAITTGTAKVTLRMPYAFTLTSVKASLTTVSSSGTPTVDINVNGSTILSTKLTIDASEKTSATAAVAAVISSASIAADDEITIDIDVAGTGATGLKVYLIGHQ